ncbi:MAG TPA: PDZ domain-containing protein [Bryobacteraceae bacterium]|nr:PDZ domain-containing protein [Bryobacteraceae bacterium]
MLRSRRVLALFLLLAVLGLAQGPAPISYTVRIPAPQTHYVEVEARVPTAGQAHVELMMAVWTPYVIREYAKNLEAVVARATDGRPLAIEKSRKNRWRIQTAGADAVVVSYRVYCHVMHVQDNWVDAEFALLNGASTFLTLADRTARPHDVQLVLPPAWKSSLTGMPSVPGAPHHYRAPDYETLVDSPIVAGNPAVHQFTVEGKPHFLVDVGEDGVFDGQRAAGDLARIVRQDARLWGGLPYDKYLFLNILTGGGGGMEHGNSTALMSTRWSTRAPDTYLRWLDVASHEFFHAWNVKRLRPAEFTPGEYETEPYTTSLGIAEGFTSYYGPLIVRRAGLSSEDQFLAGLSRMIQELQTAPGRLVQSLSMSSFDTWIKFYRPDENSVNTAISYYTKGAVAAFLLDARVRAATRGAKSLDDVMRLALARNPVARGYTPAAFRAAASEVAGTDLGAWFTKVFDSTAEIDYREALEWFGLRFAAETSGRRAWLGAVTREQDGRLVVSSIPRGTPACEAGLDTGDEIVAFNDFRVRPDEWDRRLDNYRPGDRLCLLISRRGRLIPIEVTLGSDPAPSWTLEIADPASPHRAAW